MKKKGLNLKIKKPVEDETDLNHDIITKEDPQDRIYHIIDNVYLSGYEGAKDRSTMSKLGIKTIFNCATKNCDCLFPGEFKYIEYALRDTPGADMSKIFIEIADKIIQNP